MLRTAPNFINSTYRVPAKHILALPGFFSKETKHNSPTLLQQPLGALISRSPSAAEFHSSRKNICDHYFMEMQSDRDAKAEKLPRLQCKMIFMMILSSRK
ncbi:Hypothetical predicted protein [Xyrichtys novacula]|uniref:Uncharacterized protein n=1 Tax=Xyrichtys novacula TaxID=13765 RepID=A0AAV1EY89_XYRNO|nr:Hypothetical predicted protein [Xyrichtys novacula]